jgi:hypothetical protein
MYVYITCQSILHVCTKVTPRKRIIEQAQIVQRKRQEFLTAIAKGLVPPETPPGLRKQRRRKYSMDFDSQSQVIKFTRCLPMVGGSLWILWLLPSLKLAAMI